MAQYNDKQTNPQLGVDKGIIKMFLKMTPEERLRANDNTIRAKKPQVSDLSALLKGLKEAGVEFVLVGGVGANMRIYQGAI